MTLSRRKVLIFSDSLRLVADTAMRGVLSSVTLPVGSEWIVTFQGGGGVPKQGATAGDDLDGSQDEGGAHSLGTTARGTRREIVRL